MLFRLRGKAKFVDMVDDLAQVVPALYAVLYLSEDLADLVFDGVWTAGLAFEALQIRKQLAVDKHDEIIASQRGIVVYPAVPTLGRGPGSPAIRPFEYVYVFLAPESRRSGLVLLERVEIFQEEQPGGLLGVIEFTRTTRVLPQDVVDVLECLFKHVRQISYRRLNRSEHCVK